MKRIYILTLTLFPVLAFGFWLLRVYYGNESNNILCIPNWDLYSYFYPMFEYSFKILKTGVLPLWNPYQSCGTPILATQAVGIFYPLNFIYLIFPAHVAMGISYVLHLSLAGFFMFFLCRELLFSKYSSLIASITFMLSGTILSSIYQSNRNICAIWIPLVILLLEKLLKNRNILWAILLGLTVSIQFLTGYMQFLIYTLYLAFFYTIFRIIQICFKEKNIKALWSILLLLSLGVLIAISISSIQLLPTYELSRMTIRSIKGLSWMWAVSFGSLEPEKFFYDYIFSSATLFPINGYIGFLPLLIALISIFNRSELPRTLFFTITGLVSIMLSFGHNTPFYKIYFSLPTGNWLRSPHSFLYLFTFSISILSGIGGGYLIQIIKETKKEIKNKLILSLLFCACLSAIIIYRKDIYLCIYTSFFLFTLCLLIIKKNKILLTYLQIIIAALIIFNSFYKSKFTCMHPSTNIDIYNQQEARDACDFIKSHQAFNRTYIIPGTVTTINNISITEKFATLNGIYAINDHEPYSLQRYAEFCYVLENGYFPKEAPYFGGLIRINSAAKNLKMIDLLSTKYILTDTVPFIIPDQNLKKINKSPFSLVYNNKKISIYENKNALPRVYLVNQFKVIKDRIQILNELTGSEFNPGQSVILEEDISIKDLPEEKTDIPEPIIKIDEYSTVEVKISAAVFREGILVFTDMYYPGWKVFIDGKEDKIYRANYLFRAVLLKPGKHKVRFTYDPDSFKLGRNITVSSLFLIILLGVFTSRKLKKAV